MNRNVLLRGLKMYLKNMHQMYTCMAANNNELENFNFNWLACHCLFNDQRIQIITSEVGTYKY